VALLALSAPTAAPAQQWRALMAPGPLLQEHAPVEAECDECHLVFKGVPNDKCLRCHTGLSARIRADLGYHALVRKDACIKCHQDHQGRDAQPTTEEARAAFDHATTGFTLAGAHGKLACADCHTAAVGKMPAKCAGCHEDPHAGTLGPSCGACHDSEAWDHALKTREAHQVDMSGGHAPLKCADCHAGGANLAKTVGCEACHDQEHGGTEAPCQNCHNVQAFKPAKFDHDFCTCKFPGKHRTADCLQCHTEFNFTKTPTLCSQCHAKAVTHDPLGECSICHSALTWKQNRFDHNGRRSKFHLADTHLEVDCDRCHFQKERGKVAFRAAPEDCIGCHKAQGVEAHGDFGDCARCHTTVGFEENSFEHAKTGFVVANAHDELPCQGCHAGKTAAFPKRPAPQAPAETACQHCHADPHAGRGGAECETCHGTKAWVPSSFDLARHAKTALPLVGKHAEAPCTACHLDGQLTGLPATCEQCHFDRHNGRFGKQCTDCHRETGWRPVTGFEHGLTGFELVGAHLAAECSQCHEGPNAAALEAATDKQACETCHMPEHALDLGKCRDCHREEVPFAQAGVGFEHRKTGFRLERRHAVVACKSCHPNQVGPKPLARCGSCHVSPHAGQLTPQCEDCHAPDRWSLIRFDHDASGWPLRGRHFVAPCGSCHVSERWIGLTTECHDCHALDAARARMVVPQAHPFGALDCRDCHFNAFSWR
jgi:hypothetical protein